MRSTESLASVDQLASRGGTPALATSELRIEAPMNGGFDVRGPFFSDATSNQEQALAFSLPCVPDAKFGREDS